jgi:hypothetical protein
MNVMVIKMQKYTWYNFNEATERDIDFLPHIYGWPGFVIGDKGQSSGKFSETVKMFNVANEGSDIIEGFP